uniref:Uncharacterized protein n=1 Tax=Anguilla anguilla TaxID=7936 RepID=A0A0E9U0Z8_ANGAN
MLKPVPPTVFIVSQTLFVSSVGK